MDKIKIKNLLKRSPIAMIVAGVLVAGVVSATVLLVYTTMLGVGRVEQSVVFVGGGTHKDYKFVNSDAIAGNTYTQNYNLKNRSETTAPIKFITNQCIVGGGHCGDSNHDHEEEGVETSYWSTVELSSKNSDWIVTDDMKATLTYNLVSPTFEYELEATRLTPDAEYSLIYYADKPDRFVNWGGNNPGVLIMTEKADSEGKISVKGNKNLQMNLPHANDANNDEYDYCKTKANGGTDDMYDLCHGAKIWLVPTSDLPNPYPGDGKWKFWDTAGILFETDLITYDDSDTDGEALYLGEGMLNFFVKNVLDVALAPGEYKVKTEIIPVPEVK